MSEPVLKDRSQETARRPAAQTGIQRLESGGRDANDFVEEQSYPRRDHRDGVRENQIHARFEKANGSNAIYVMPDAKYARVNCQRSGRGCARRR